MTRAQIIDMIDDFGNSLGPSGSNEQNDADRTRWIRHAPDEWLDILVDIAVNPPAYWDNGRATVAPFDGQFELVNFLGEWGHLRPLGWAQKVGPLLAHKRVRSTILQVMGEARNKEGIVWLAPLIDQWNDLDSDELEYLADAFADIGGATSRQLLEKMKATIPLEYVGVHGLITTFLSGKGFEHIPHHFDD